VGEDLVDLYGASYGGFATDVYAEKPPSGNPDALFTSR
jgi:hypothetical protein